MAYLPLSTANLPDPVIDPAQGASPEDYFNTVLYTGTGSAVDINTVGFQPDLVWGKKRSAPNQNNWLIDSVRGAGVWLASDGTGAEGTEPAGSSFDADGFNTNSNSLFTYTGGSYVMWSWKANGSGVTNTDGSITSTVSANTTSGFSIVSYTGTGANATVGHGLDSAPEMIIFKERNGATNWPVYHSGLSSAAYALELNQTLAQFSYPAYFQSTAPTSSVFYIGTDTYINNSSDTYIAYCFHSVDGFSKFGSYVGNGSADGAFVYTGFRPAFVMIKRTDSTQDWHIVDVERSTFNTVIDYLLPNSSGAEFTSSSNPIDLLSNGFKFRDTGSRVNASGGTYIFMAFSDANRPFKYSNAR